MRLPFVLAVAIGAVAIAEPQNAPPAPQQAPSTAAQAETTTKDEPVTFQARVNLVMVPVVVRDKAGRAIGTLKKEDFQLFDKGKVQLISRFSIERPASPPGAPDRNAKPKPPAEGEEPPLAMPERYLAYVFDDIHLNSSDLMRVRNAAWTHIDTMLRPADRAAVYTTSGQIIAEFTDDKQALHDTLLRLMPHPIGVHAMHNCPDVSYYMADLIQNKNDSMALAAAVSETFACANMTASSAADIASAQSMARAAASQALSVGDQETRVTLGVLRDIVRRMGALPGQRSIILASPGFETPMLYQELTDVLDRAIRTEVTISTLDARGLWTDPTFDASRTSYSASATMMKSRYDRDAMLFDADVLAEFASGTGGNFFQNSNDLEAGFRKLAEPPEYIYLLGFSPQNLKLDGSYHELKVKLAMPAGLAASARKGYYAPRHLSDAAETAKEEIREAIFSREELHELPIALHTQFFKPGNDSARVTVVAQIDLKQLHFRKVDGRNRNDLTIVAAIFDRNGNYVTGNQKTLEMRLRDETIQQRANTGFTIRSAFDVKPGAYLIRLVVRDAEGQQMAAQNGSVDIP